MSLSVLLWIMKSLLQNTRAIDILLSVRVSRKSSGTAQVSSGKGLKPVVLEKIVISLTGIPRKESLITGTGNLRFFPGFLFHSGLNIFPVKSGYDLFLKVSLLQVNRSEIYFHLEYLRARRIC